jgi:carboxylesterase
MTHPLIKNPHLDGDPFFLEGGPVGVLLVHGFTATPVEMRPLGDFLHKKGFTVSGPLLPGHNTAPEDINKFTWKDWVAHTENAYWNLNRNCEQVFIGGESMGGLLAIYLATYHPEIVGILTYAPALRLIARKRDVIKLYLLAPFIPYIKRNDADDNLPWRGYLATPLRGVIQLLKLQRRTISRLESIRRPILIIQGCLDARIPSEVPGIIFNRVSSVLKEIHWMQNSTHCVVIDKEMESVKEITLRFIEKALG